MEQTNAKELLDKYKAGTCTEQELAILEIWYKDLEVFQVSDISEPDIDTDLNQVYGLLPVHGQQTRKVRLWPRIAVAASLILVAGATLFYYNLRKTDTKSEVIAAANDIAPGKIGATLTLSSGKKIKLTEAANGELAQQAGVTITKSANGQLIYELKGSGNERDKINTLATANGETYQLRLPDGSLVYLNAASSLTYSASLMEGGKRIVKLRGEGYFQVAKDKAHPFIVKTDQQEVEVLGTHFNINAYEDENAITTTLLEGSVKVTAGGKGNRTLKPGEQALTQGNSINISVADTENAVAWKNGEFIFNDESIESVMRRIARWYNVEVVFEGNIPSSGFNGVISTRKNISEVLRVLQKTKGVHFKVEGRRVTVIE